MSDETQPVKADERPAPASTEKQDQQKAQPAPANDFEAKFEAQRKVNRDLEEKYNGLKDGFAKALGIEQGEKPSVEDLLGRMQSRLEQMERTNLVAQIARDAKITDPEDIATISEATTEEGMRRIAARISSSTAPATPKPDRTQGNQGSANKPDPGPGVPRLAAAFEDEFTK